jgi:hypothetical protein
MNIENFQTLLTKENQKLKFRKHQNNTF